MMKVLGKYWKLLIVVLLLGLAAFMYLEKYKTAEAAHEAKTQQMETMILALENNIRENMQYADIQDQLEDAKAELEASRLELYKNFPVEMKEEDQIMYVLYLETLFETEIFFSFSEAQGLVALQDGAVLEGLLITVNYETTYQGFQDMVNILATDSRIASVYQATIEYDQEKDVASGYLTLILYLMDSDQLEYTPPDVAIPDTGKDNLFE